MFTKKGQNKLWKLTRKLTASVDDYRDFMATEAYFSGHQKPVWSSFLQIHRNLRQSRSQVQGESTERRSSSVESSSSRSTSRRNRPRSPREAEETHRGRGRRRTGPVSNTPPGMASSTSTHHQYPPPSRHQYQH